MVYILHKTIGRVKLGSYLHIDLRQAVFNLGSLALDNTHLLCITVALTMGGNITVRLTSCLTCSDSAALLCKKYQEI